MADPFSAALAVTLFVASSVQGSQNARRAEKQNRLAMEQQARTQQEQKKQQDADRRSITEQRNSTLETVYGRTRGSRSLLAGGAQTGFKPTTLG
jgi:type II secretory pathway pseudopilin PulG